jgi:hypothetical protein
VVGIIFVAGVFGGFVNFALARSSHSTWFDAWWSVVIGIGAAFLVPLFLNTISSSLLSGILSNSVVQADIFVFFGFCLLGAIASRTMIQTLSQKLLRSTEETKREVQKLKEEVKPIIIKETEPDETELETQGQANAGVRIEAYGINGADHLKIIKALGDSKYSRRTVKGIREATDAPLEKVYELLSWLHMNGLATTTGDPDNYWSLSKKGHRVFNSTIKDNP